MFFTGCRHTVQSVHVFNSCCHLLTQKIIFLFSVDLENLIKKPARQNNWKNSSKLINLIFSVLRYCAYFGGSCFCTGFRCWIKKNQKINGRKNRRLFGRS